MKNRTLLIVSLILIAFLIGNSYAPSGAPQTVMAQESDPYEGMMDLPEFNGKGTLITGIKEEIYQQQDTVASDLKNYYVPGFAFKRADDKSASDTGRLIQSWLWGGRAVYINEDMETYVELHYPVQIPDQSMISGIQVCGQIVYRVEPYGTLTAHLFRFHWATKEMEIIAQVSLDYQSSEGRCAYFALDEPHEFDPYTWNYQLLVILGASSAEKNVYELSQVNLYYVSPVTLFPLAFPTVITKP
ncbi:MAG: hypothetical protein GX884_01615 [Chloroflexi bacterium]|jgi:hypothetical protein|nr:hypothetical protein [Chloroflexota bacterium]